MNCEIEKIIVDLIQTSLNLPDNYGLDSEGNKIPCVTIKSQNIKLFTTPLLQITVSTLSSKVFANRKEYFEQEVKHTIEEDGEQKEVVEYILAERICMNDQRVMQIDVYSRTNDARQRFWEIQACLNSTYCEQLQDKYQFRISRISNATNLSGLDGGSDINRYTIRFNCLAWYEKINTPDFYNSFDTEVWDEIPGKFAEFTIQ